MCLAVPHGGDDPNTQCARCTAPSAQIAGRTALADLAVLPLHRYPHDFLLSRGWDLRKSLSAHDAVYVAVAEALQAPLVTRDKRLAAAPGHHARIELI
jgi:predicted nucleic acid-binding protein